MVRSKLLAIVKNRSLNRTTDLSIMGPSYGSLCKCTHMTTALLCAYTHLRDVFWMLRKETVWSNYLAPDAEGSQHRGCKCLSDTDNGIYKDKDKDKDLFIGQQEFVVGYSKAPSSRRAALGLYVILTLWRGRGANQPPYALLHRSSTRYALRHGRLCWCYYKKPSRMLVTKTYKFIMTINCIVEIYCNN